MAQKPNKAKLAVPVPKDPPTQQLIAATQEYSGPIPPASEFARYGEVIPDAPERILKVFEDDSAHVREMQKAALDAEVGRDKRGQYMAFFIIMGTFGVTAYCLYLGQAVAALVSGLASVFLAFKGVFGPRSNNEKSSNKGHKPGATRTG